MKYPGLEKYIIDHNLSLREFSEMCGLCNSEGKNKASTIHRYLSGKTNPGKKNIDKILKATGMTYEEAFQEGDKL